MPSPQTTKIGGGGLIGGDGTLGGGEGHGGSGDGGVGGGGGGEGGGGAMGGALGGNATVAESTASDAASTPRLLARELMMVPESRADASAASASSPAFAKETVAAAAVTTGAATLTEWAWSKLASDDCSDEAKAFWASAVMSSDSPDSGMTIISNMMRYDADSDRRRTPVEVPPLALDGQGWVETNQLLSPVGEVCRIVPARP